MRNIFAIVILISQLPVFATLPKIVGGKETTPDKLPWHIHLHNWRAVCSGALISDRHILTAAHCMNKRWTKSYQVMAGGTGQWRDLVNIGKIASVKVHEEFDKKNLVNDIALITLKQPVVFSKTVKSIPLVGRDFSVYELIDQTRYHKYTVSGYGVTDGGRRSQTLKYTDTLKPIPPFTDRNYWSDISNRQTHLGTEQDVNQVYTEEMAYKANWIISAKVDSSACNGDSGGPAVAFDKKFGKKVLVGLTSYGTTPCSEYSYGINFHTNVSEYLDWIEAAINEQ